MIKKISLCLTLNAIILSTPVFASQNEEPPRIAKRFNAEFTPHGIKLPLDITTNIARHLNSNDAKSFSLVCKAASNGVDGRFNLRLLSNRNGPYIDEDTYIRILQTKRNLKCLMAGDALDNVSAPKLLTTLKLCPSLLVLDLEGRGFGDNSVVALTPWMKNLQNLRSLNVSDSLITAEQFDLIIKHTPALEAVNIWPCPNITEDNINTMFAECPSIRVCRVGAIGNTPIISEDFLNRLPERFPNVHFLFNRAGDAGDFEAAAANILNEN